MNNFCVYLCLNECPFNLVLRFKTDELKINVRNSVKQLKIIYIYVSLCHCLVSV